MNPMLATISVTRLHNLGDYEHAKYEVTLTVPAEQSGEILAMVDGILKRLKPVREPFNLAHAERVFAQGPAYESDAQDMLDMTFDVAESIVQEHRKNIAFRQAAIEELNKLGAQLKGGAA